MTLSNTKKRMRKPLKLSFHVMSSTLFSSFSFFFIENRKSELFSRRKEMKVPSTYLFINHRHHNFSMPTFISLIRQSFKAFSGNECALTSIGVPTLSLIYCAAIVVVLMSKKKKKVL